MKKSIISLLLLVSTTAFAGLTEGLQAYDQGNLDVARQEFESAVSKGDAEAGFYLGYMFADGQGVTKDTDKAIEYFELAAERGDASAQYQLALIYDEGKGVLQDYVSAAEWYQAAAVQGVFDAQYRLAEMYESGMGVNCNLVYAHALFNLAATSGEQNYMDARQRLTEKMSVEQLNQAQKLASDWEEDSPFPLDTRGTTTKNSSSGQFVANSH